MIEAPVTVPAICRKCGSAALLYIAPNGDAWQIQWIAPYECDIGLVHNTRIKHTHPDHFYCKDCKEYFHFAHFQKEEITEDK